MLSLRSLLVDEVSRIYFDARRSYLENPSLSDFYLRIRKAGAEYRFRDLDRFFDQHGIDSWVVWGVDDDALYNGLVLSDSKYDYLGNCLGTTARLSKGVVPVLDTQTALRLIRSRRCGVLVSSQTQQQDVELLEGVPRDKMLVVEGHLVGRCGWQYFDFFKPRKNEYFVDAGCLDGKSSAEFVEWCGNDYGHIYAFEANPLSIGECRRGMSAFGAHGTLFECALLDRVGFTRFDSLGRSRWDARVDDFGQNVVPCTTLDEALRNQPISYIKLDIEGSELRALRGAYEVITKNHPRLAVSVYHNGKDLFSVMKLLLEMAPYSFAIRHYHSDLIETILYAF